MSICVFSQLLCLRGRRIDLQASGKACMAYTPASTAAHPAPLLADASIDCLTWLTYFWPLAPFLFFMPKVLSSTACTRLVPVSADARLELQALLQK